MLFGTDDLMLIGEAQLRHVKEIDGGILISFQFTSIRNAATGSRAINAISAKISEYQRRKIQDLRVDDAVAGRQPSEEPLLAETEEAAEAALEEPGRQSVVTEDATPQNAEETIAGNS